MARQFLVEPAAGFVKSFPDDARREIKSKWPSVPVKRIEGEFTNYMLYRPAAEAQPEAAEIEQRYTKLQEAVRSLMTEIQWLNRNNLGRVLEQEFLEYSNILDETYDKLMVVNALLPRGRKHLPQGHQVKPSYPMAFNVGCILQDAGLPINAKPTGPLCQLVEIVLNAAGENPKGGVIAIVKAILPILKKRLPKIS